MENAAEKPELNNVIQHKTVFLERAVELLVTKPNGVFVDATLGGGGHTRHLLEKFPQAKVIAFDWDKQAIDRAYENLLPDFENRLRLAMTDFSQIKKALHKLKEPSVNGILADFGTSQMQIFGSEGFSFAQDTVLDMRMSKAHKHVTAQEILESAQQEELEYIFSCYGQEPLARLIAKKIVHIRKKTPIVTAVQLAQLVEGVVVSRTSRRKTFTSHPATKVFQALRIAVNTELENIEEFLKQAFTCLAPQGRLVCISFHSLEDRIVKNFFRDFCLQNSESKIITKKPIEADEQEALGNPSCRSAKMRVLEK